jgi:hypothetical protein
MPTYKRLISPIQKAALLECFQQATSLVPLELRHQFILIGGMASIAHSSCRLTEDVDVAASPEAYQRFLEAVRKGARNFKIRPCETIEFNNSQGFLITLEILQLGGPFVESIAVSEPFLRGFLASPTDLFLLRAVTVVDRGEERDLEDFKWLLWLMAERGSILPELGSERVEAVVGAARDLTLCERLLLLALLSVRDWARIIM